MEGEVLTTVPVQFLDSITCYTIVDDEDVLVVSCHENGYVYEFVNKKILSSLNLNEKASKIEQYYFTEDNTTVNVYIIHTESKKLMLVKKDKYLQLHKTYSNVEEFEVFDFENVGCPQVRIVFCDTKPDKIVNIFNVNTEDEPSQMLTNSKSTQISDALSEKLQLISLNVNDLEEEKSELCNLWENVREAAEIKLIKRWWNVLGEYLAVGLKICNTANECIKDIKVVIQHKSIKTYFYKCFSVSKDNSIDSIQSLPPDFSLGSGQQIFVIGAFRIPVILFQSETSFDFYLTCPGVQHLKETVHITFPQIATSTLDLTKELTVSDLMIVMTVKEETRVEIKVDTGEEKDLMESVLVSKLQFKNLTNINNNLFYCTSTFLNEMLIFCQQVSTTPAKWTSVWYTRDDTQLYILVNALYDLLPENTSLLLDK